jgi:hypothetical protein
MDPHENPVLVDSDELAAEAERVELPPGEPAAPAGEGAAPVFQLVEEPPPAAWAEITPGIVEAVDLFVCPAWELTAPEKSALADALAPALDQAFPGGIGDERWAPYFRLLIVAGGIVAMRFDRNAGKLKPLRVKSADDPAPDLEGAAAAPGSAGFTMGGGARSQ